MTDDSEQKPPVQKVAVSGHGKLHTKSLRDAVGKMPPGKVEQPPAEDYPGAERSPDRFPVGPLQQYAAAMEGLAVACRFLAAHDLPLIERTIKFAFEHADADLLAADLLAKKREALAEDLKLVQAAIPLWTLVQEFDRQQPGGNVEGSTTIAGDVSGKAAVVGGVVGGSGVKG